MPTIPKKQPRRSYMRKPQPKTGTGDQAFYNSPAWRKARAAYMNEHPNHSLCRVSLEKGDHKPADVIDHIIPISAGGARLHPDNFMPMTHFYHNRKRGYESNGWVPEARNTEDGLVPTKAGRYETLQKLLKQ